MTWAGEWLESAACASVDPDLFFPDQGDSPLPAKRICAGCAVIHKCRQRWESLTVDQRGYGIWWGSSAHDRRNERVSKCCLRCGLIIAPHRSYCKPCAGKRRRETDRAYSVRKGRAVA